MAILQTYMPTYENINPPLLLKWAPQREGDRPCTSTQLSMEGASSNGTKYKWGSVRWKECTEAVTTFIAKEMVAFNTVEKLSFKSSLKALDCQYELLSRKHFSQVAVPEICNRLRNKIQFLISDGPHYTLTTRG